MISYLVDGVLLIALALTGWRVAKIYRELRQLRAYHTDYRRVLDDTGIAVEVVETTVRDINAHGAQILLALGDRIDEAYRTIGEIDERMEAVAEHFEAERAAASNVLPFSAYPPNVSARATQPRYADPDLVEDHGADDREPALRSQARPDPRPEKPVKWPTLGDRFNQWRNSDAARPLKTAAAQRR